MVQGEEGAYNQGRIQDFIKGGAIWIPNWYGGFGGRSPPKKPAADEKFLGSTCLLARF